MPRRRPVIATLVTLAVVLGCSPIVRVEAHFELPPGAGTLDPKRLHLRGRVSCHSYNLSDAQPKHPAPPPIGLEETDPDETSTPLLPDAQADASALPVYHPRPPNEERSVSFVREGTVARAQFRSSSCWIALTAFYDTNGNGIPDEGDYVAAVPPVLVADRGLCAGNLNTIGPVKLQPLR